MQSRSSNSCVKLNREVEVSVVALNRFTVGVADDIEGMLGDVIVGKDG